MQGHFSYLESIGAGTLYDKSHGEAFLDFVAARSGVAGLWVLDEPESALSFSGCLTLIGLLRELLVQGSQVVLSMHSSILAAIPDADVYEVGDWGLRDTSYEQLELVQNWRMSLDAPERYMRHFV